MTYFLLTELIASPAFCKSYQKPTNHMVWQKWKMKT